MTTSLKPIQTRDKGFHFRSRLEARWAVAFDALGLSWEYEPQGFDLGDAGHYLPDFWLPSLEMWAEVKPGELSLDEMKKATSLADASDHRVLLLIGTPAPAAYWYIEPWGPERNQKWKVENPGQDPTFLRLLAHESSTLDAVFGKVGDFSPFDPQHRQHFEQFDSYSCQSHPFPFPVEVSGQDMTAIHAARSARFEHGHSGATIYTHAADGTRC